MAADIASSLNSWSATAASNQPDNTDAVGPNILAENLRQIQAVMRANIAGSDTIASGATCDLGSKEANYLSVTGTTTITSFGSTGTAGIIKILEFADAVTVTNGASLDTGVGGNVTTTAGNVCMVRCEGSGVWTVLFWWGLRGTWTPSLTASGSTFNIASALGAWELNGRALSIRGGVTLATSGNTLTADGIIVSGAPFTMNATPAISMYGACSFTGMSSTNIQSLVIRNNGNSTQFIPDKLVVGGTGYTPLLANDLSATAGAGFTFNVTVRI